jgi:hypothetical protein
MLYSLLRSCVLDRLDEQFTTKADPGQESSEMCYEDL